MARDTKEIMKQIKEKNILLKSLSRDRKTDNDKINTVKTELDRLLYLYIKSLKFGSGGIIMC